MCEGVCLCKDYKIQPTAVNAKLPQVGYGSRLEMQYKWASLRLIFKNVIIYFFVDIRGQRKTMQSSNAFYYQKK